MLVAGPASVAQVLPLLERHRPDLRWEVRAELSQAAFDLCSGHYEMVVVDGERAMQQPDQMLITVRRCAPDTRLVVHADDLAHPTLRALAACGWLARVRTDALAQAIA